MKKSTAIDQSVSDYLMWVGAVYYPTVDTYINEAKVRGVCKRLGHLPSNLVVGKSKIFLAHDDGLNGEGFIFGYFVPSELQYLAEDDQDIPYNIYDSVTWIDDWSDEESRECGDRSEGLYVVQATEGAFVIFKMPRELEAFDPDRKHFRGMLQIDYGQKVIDAKIGNCTIPPSRMKPTRKNVGDKELVRRMTNGSISKVAQQIAYETGMSKGSLIYRFNVLTGRTSKLDDPEEDEAEEFEQQISVKRLKDAAKGLKKGKFRFA